MIYLWRSATISTSTATNTHRPLPSAPASHTHEHDFSTIFSNFQTLLVAFFQKTYILTNLATFLKKPKLSFSWKMSPVLPREHEVCLSRRCVTSPGAVSRLPALCHVSRRCVTSLGVCSEQRAAERQCIQLAVPQQTRQYVIYKTAFPSTCLDF